MNKVRESNKIVRKLRKVRRSKYGGGGGGVGGGGGESIHVPCNFVSG